jgi:hypothetical protein
MISTYNLVIKAYQHLEDADYNIRQAMKQSKNRTLLKRTQKQLMNTMRAIDEEVQVHMLEESYSKNRKR